MCENNDPRTVSELDQVDQELRNLSALMGSYYWSLIKNGIPQLLAHDLVKEYHFLVITRGDGE